MFNNTRHMPQVEIEAAYNKMKEMAKEHPNTDIVYDADNTQVVAVYKVKTDYDCF